MPNQNETDPLEKRSKEEIAELFGNLFAAKDITAVRGNAVALNLPLAELAKQRQQDERVS
jgi:hypothetical protein